MKIFLNRYFVKKLLKKILFWNWQNLVKSTSKVLVRMANQNVITLMCYSYALKKIFFIPKYRFQINLNQTNNILLNKPASNDLILPSFPSRLSPLPLPSLFFPIPRLSPLPLPSLFFPILHLSLLPLPSLFFSNPSFIPSSPLLPS